MTTSWTTLEMNSETDSEMNFARGFERGSERRFEHASGNAFGGTAEMPAGLLVASLAAGIVWADLGGRVSDRWVAAWSGLAVLLLVVLAIRVRDGRCSGSRAPLLAAVGLAGAAALAFLAGHEALTTELERARRDLERAERIDPTRVRLAEARVDSRDAGRWGDEVGLVSVRAVDGGRPLPESLLLRLGHQAREPPPVAPSRAERVLWPGAHVRLGLRVAPLRSARNPGQADRERVRARRGWAARARLVDPDWILSLARAGAWRLAWHARLERVRADWREQARMRLAGAGRGAGLARALGVGDRSGLRDATRDAFRRLGLAHLLAVSGLHVGFVAGLAGWLFVHGWVWAGRCGRGWPFDAGLCVACVAASGYAWLSAAGVSVERAALLFALFAVGRLCLRQIAPGAALAWVACGILLTDPAALFDVGAQLSFGACGGLVFAGCWGAADGRRDACVERDSSPLERARRMSIDTARASLVASLATAPILVQHGLAPSLLSPLLNVWAVPWTGLLVLPSALLAIGSPAAIPRVVLSALLWPAGCLERWVEYLAARLPDAPSSAWLPWPLLLAVVVHALHAARRGRWRRAALVWIGVCLAGAAPIVTGPFPPRRPEVIFFDVGQGDAALVQGRHATLLVDTGPGPADGSGGAALVRALRAVGVDSLDVLSVSHADLDHRGGAIRVLESFSVGELWLPRSGARDAPLVALARLAGRRGARVRWLAADSVGYQRGDLDVQVLWPPVSSRAPVSRNAASLVLRVQIEEAVVLFTADIGTRAEAILVAEEPHRLAADVLKIAHHGSRSSSSRDFLDAVDASVAVLSAPCDATRGLPNAQTLARLQRSGRAVWWTGRDGAVFVSPRVADPATAAASGHLRIGEIQPREPAVRSWARPRRCERRD